MSKSQQKHLNDIARRFSESQPAAGNTPSESPKEVSLKPGTIVILSLMAITFISLLILF